MISWEQLKPFHRKLVSIKLGRKAEVESNYNAFKGLIKDIRTFLFAKLLKYECPVILPNNFPYDLDDNIEHYCLWWISDPPQTFYCPEIEKFISEYFHGQEVIYFENNPEARSIQEIKHLHIFRLHK